MNLSLLFEKNGNWLFKYRSSLPLIMFAASIAVFIYMKLYPQTSPFYNTPYEKPFVFFAFATAILGFIVRIYTVGHSAPNTSGRNTENQVADSLNTTGIYSIVRNPLYIGNFFMWLGPALLTENFWFVCFFIVLFILFYERIIFAEEQYLIGKFGETYLNWTKRTPCVLPRFSQFQRSPAPFNWKKVFRQEKNGLVAIFLIFAFFDILRVFISGDKSYNSFFVIGSAVSLILYFILKYLKYNSDLLKD
jgi:protein-S-isoprenylcysteine O-methyltransferase Ste14